MSPTSWRTSSRASRRTPGQGAGSGRRCTLPPLSPALPALREHWHRIAPNRARQAIVTRKAGRPDLGRRAVRATCRGHTPVTLMDLFAMRSRLSRIPSTSSAPRRVDSPVLLMHRIGIRQGRPRSARTSAAGFQSILLRLWRAPTGTRSILLSCVSQGSPLQCELHKMLRHSAVDLEILVTRSVFAAPGDVA